MLAEQPHTGAPTFNMPYGGAEGAYPVTTEHYSRAPLFQRIESSSSMTGDHYNELQESQRELEKYRQRTYELERMYAESEKISAAQRGRAEAGPRQGRYIGPTSGAFMGALPWVILPDSHRSWPDSALGYCFGQM